jgi:hypothetical protein
VTARGGGSRSPALDLEPVDPLELAARPSIKQNRSATLFVMSSALTVILQEALQLSDDERLDLARELLASVEGPVDPGWADAWSAQLDDRSRSTSSTSDTPRTWEAVREDLVARRSR